MNKIFNFVLKLARLIMEACFINGFVLIKDISYFILNKIDMVRHSANRNKFYNIKNHVENKLKYDLYHQFHLIIKKYINVHAIIKLIIILSLFQLRLSSSQEES